MMTQNFLTASPNLSTRLGSARSRRLGGRTETEVNLTEQKGRDTPTLRPTLVGKLRKAGIQPQSHSEVGPELHLTKLLAPKFASLNLASDGFGELGHEPHLAEEKADHPD